METMYRGRLNDIEFEGKPVKHMSRAELLYFFEFFAVTVGILIEEGAAHETLTSN